LRTLARGLRRLALAAAGLLASATAPAIDPGSAKGRLEVEGQAIALTHAYAHEHDNAEGLLDGRELRLLLADRAIPQRLLGGVDLAELEALARSDGVRGVLLIVDPARPRDGLRAVVLPGETRPANALPSFGKSGINVGFPRLEVTGTRVQGEARYETEVLRRRIAYAATFSAPLFREERLSARYLGTPALRSAPFLALAAHAKALREGNFEAAGKLATREHTRAIDALIAREGREAVARRMRETAIVPDARDRPRVFVRGATALIVYQSGVEIGTQPMRLERGRWLVD